MAHRQPAGRRTPPKDRKAAATRQQARQETHREPCGRTAAGLPNPRAADPAPGRATAGAQAMPAPSGRRGGRDAQPGARSAPPAPPDPELSRLIAAVNFPVALLFRPRPVPPELGLRAAPLPCDLSRLSAVEIAGIERLVVTVLPTHDAGVVLGGEIRRPNVFRAIDAFLRQIRGRR